MATSLDSYMPYDSGPGANVTENGWRSFMRRVGWTGVIPNVLNQLHTFGDSTGRQVKVDTGECWIEGQWGQCSALKILPIAANTSGNTRIDLVVCRNDFVNNNMVFDVIQGVPGASPVVPSPTQNTSLWEIPLAQVTVGNNVSTITAGNVVDARAWSTSRPSLAYTGTNLKALGATVSGSSGSTVLMTCAIPDPGVPYQISVSGAYGGSNVVGGFWHNTIQTVSGSVIATCYPVQGFNGTWQVAMPRAVYSSTFTGAQTVQMLANWDGSSSFATSGVASVMYLQVEVIPTHS